MLFRNKTYTFVIKKDIYRYIKVKTKRIVIIILIALALVPTKVRAQYDVYFSHYFDMQTSFNPAASGLFDKLNINASYAMSMVGFENSPKTAYVSADMPFNAFNTRNGVGVSFMNDKKGLFSRQQINAQYSYQKKFWEGRLAIGVQAGLLSESFDGSKVDIEDTTDPAFSKSDVKGNSIDFGFGLHYSNDQWYVGVSAQHLTSPTVELGETNEINIDPTLYATGGYTFKMNNPLFSVATSAFVATDLVGYRGELSARLIYTYEGRTMSAGLGYSPKNSTTIYLAGSFHGIMLGYSYDIYTSGINFENGSHELFIGYQTDINFMPTGKNRHQSVRHL